MESAIGREWIPALLIDADCGNWRLKSFVETNVLQRGHAFSHIRSLTRRDLQKHAVDALNCLKQPSQLTHLLIGRR